MLFRKRLGWLVAVSLLVGGAGCSEDEGRPTGVASPWARHTIDARFRGADGVRIADVNGDGLADVTTAWEQSGITRAYLHPGFEAVREPWPAVTVGVTPQVEDAVWVDVDGDGHMDVVSSAEGRTRAIFVSFAPSDPADFLDPHAWRTEVVPATLGRQWMYALPMQIDGQDGIDLVLGSKRGKAIVGWLQSPPNPRDLSAWTLHEIAPAGWVMSIDAIDMNGDGRQDLLVSDRSPSPVRGVRWLENPGPGSAAAGLWTQHFVGARDRNPVFIAPVPGASGPQRIVVPVGGRQLSLFQRVDDAEDIWDEVPLMYPRHVGDPKAAAVGDVDLNGSLDIVLTCTNLVGREDSVVWLSDAAHAKEPETESYSISGPEGEKFDRIELLDLDGDGDLDVLTTEEIQQLGVIWYENPTR